MKDINAFFPYSRSLELNPIYVTATCVEGAEQSDLSGQYDVRTLVWFPGWALHCFSDVKNFIRFQKFPN